MTPSTSIGRVEAATGGAVVVVDDPGGIIEAGDPVAPRRIGSGHVETVRRTRPARHPRRPPRVRIRRRFAGLGGTLPLDAGAAGLGTLLAISAASLAVTLLRREQSRRRMATRIAGRLATFVGGPAGSRPRTSPEPRSAERGPSTIHSA